MNVVLLNGPLNHNSNRQLGISHLDAESGTIRRGRMVKYNVMARQ